ncbi:MAG: hypothetical protein LBC68_01880 [Prevotellaceae bacterium]|jgi:hypothetical protein|nr:hypothetical protein [Prevotellaceae bacterium]
MATPYVRHIIDRIQSDFGKLKKIGDGNSLFEISSNGVLIYFRYSKLTQKNKMQSGFYGLRHEDVKLLSGKIAFICFVWDRSDEPVLIPFNNFEYSFGLFPPSSDGQYKAHILLKQSGTEFYLANVGKFNVDSFIGLSQLYEIGKTKLKIPELSHTQIQSLIGSIGVKKGFELWYPENDKSKIDNQIVDYSKIRTSLPKYGIEIDHIITEIDCIWLQDSKPISFFEVEHSTPIYSGLLRFNDVLLTIAGTDNFNIVAERERENKFGREVNRPTFKQNKLIEKVTFLDYENIYHWYYNLYGKIY